MKKMTNGRKIALILAILGIFFWFNSCYGEKMVSQGIGLTFLAYICFLGYFYLILKEHRR